MKKAIFLSLLCCLLTHGPRLAAQDSAFRVVINMNNEIGEIEKARLSEIFLKRITKWDDGSQIEPVDQDERSEVRSAFSRDIHGKSVSAIKSYWQRMIFSGRDTPPPELTSDDKVIQFVNSHPGAIGYVTASAKLDGVRVLRILQ